MTYMLSGLTTLAKLWSMDSLRNNWDRKLIKNINCPPSHSTPPFLGCYITTTPHTPHIPLPPFLDYHITTTTHLPHISQHCDLEFWKVITQQFLFHGEIMDQSSIVVSFGVSPDAAMCCVCHHFLLYYREKSEIKWGVVHLRPLTNNKHKWLLLMLQFSLLLVPFTAVSCSLCFLPFSFASFFFSFLPFPFLSSLPFPFLSFLLFFFVSVWGYMYVCLLVCLCLILCVVTV